MIREVPSPAEARKACATLIARLPDWFGIPESNAAYVNGVADCICLGAFDTDGTCLGLIALRQHFETTLEVWWMAVDPDRHRQGIGKSLMAAARDKAARLGCSDMVLMTLAEESDDPGYASTRSFYAAQGFRPLVHDHMGDPDCPLIWMIMHLGQAGAPVQHKAREVR